MSLDMECSESECKLKFKHELDDYLEEEFRTSTTSLTLEGSDGAGSGITAKEWMEQLGHTLATPPAFTVVRVNDYRHQKDDVRETLQSYINKQFEQKGMAPPQIVPHPLLKDVLVIPSGSREGSKVTPVEKEVIVDLACGMAVLRGAEIFAPGVMSAPVAMHRGDKVSVYSDIKGLCRRGQTTTFDGDRLFLGNGQAIMSRHDIFVATSTPSGTAVVITESLFDCPSLNSVLPDRIFLQNLPSVVVGHVLYPQPGEIILDMCAAPGGKTTHIGTLMRDQGMIIALDKASKKIGKIEANAAAFGLTCIKAFCFDGTKACAADSRNDTSEALNCLQPPFPAMTFDRILLDAPCSALGQRPQAYNKMSLNELKSYPALQRKLFSSAVKLLKEGGTLVYSTCTITLAENEGLVAWALQKYPEMRLLPQEPRLSGPGLPHPDLSTDLQLRLQRFRPSSRLAKGQEKEVSCDNDTIGFFIAKFIKCQRT